MSSLEKGSATYHRAISHVTKGLIGADTPEHYLTVAGVAAPGAVGNWVFVAPAPCKVVSIRESHTTAGAGSSKVYLRKHLAAHAAAANAATSGANITDVVTGGIAADSTVNTPQSATPNDNATMATGDKLALVTPATYAGYIVQIGVVFL